MELDGKVALVTGAAKGIGTACVDALVEGGARVLATDVDPDVDTLNADQVVALRHDVTSEHDWGRAAEALRDRFDGVHILVNNAGVASLADVVAEDLDTWQRVVLVNQTGVWLGMKAIGPMIERQGGGSIINMSSIFGSVGGFGGSVAYHATKGAVRNMTKNAALFWARAGVRVNSVHPAFVDTPMLDAVKGTPYEQAIIDATPMGRLARADEVGNVVRFLASDAASYITGSEIYVDGGWTAR